MNDNLIVVALSSGVVIKLLDMVFETVKRKWFIKDKKIEKNNNVEKRLDLMSKALRAMLRSQILSFCSFYIKQESVSEQDLLALNDLYVQYKALGGNGFVDKEIETVQELPRK